MLGSANFRYGGPIAVYGNESLQAKGCFFATGGFRMKELSQRLLQKNLTCIYETR